MILVDHVGGRVCDGPVEKPVAGCSHGKTLGTRLEREELAGDDPGDWTPGAGEEEDVNAHEGDGRALSWQIVGSGNSTGDCDDI